MCPFRRSLLSLVAVGAACDPAGELDLMADAGSPLAELAELAPCTRHADCASGLCRHATGSPDAGGACVAEARVLYVDRGRCGGDNDGSRARPFCTIGAALAQVDDTRRHVRIYPGFYPPFTAAGVAASLYGSDPGGPPVDVTEEDYRGSLVDAGADLLLDGLVLGRHSTVGLRCQGGSHLVVRRAEVASDTGVGLVATGCTLRVDRARLSGRDGALRLVDSSYLVTNSLVTGASERSAVVLDGGSGRVLLSTITGNGDPSAAAPAVTCTGPAALADSIVFGNARGPGGSQLAGACRLARVVIGADDPFAAAGAIRLDPDVDAGPVLRRTAGNLACCIDRAPVREAIAADLAGAPRPQGARFDIGAAEAP